MEKKSMEQIGKLVVAVALIGTSGCASTAVHSDSKSMRQHALDYYSDEIIDNLIRAKNGQFFVHMDITSLQATVTNAIKPSITAGRTGGSSRYAKGVSVEDNGSGTVTKVTNALGSAGSAVATVSRPVSGTLGVEHTDNLQVQAKPVFAEEAGNVYAPYIQFLNLTSDRMELSDATVNYVDLSKGIQSVEFNQKRPKEGTYIDGTLRYRKRETQWGYYFIPIGYKQQYFDLCLALTARGIFNSTYITRAASPDHPNLGNNVKQKDVRLQEQILQQTKSLLSNPSLTQ